MPGILLGAHSNIFMLCFKFQFAIIYVNRIFVNRIQCEQSCFDAERENVFLHFLKQTEVNKNHDLFIQISFP